MRLNKTVAGALALGAVVLCFGAMPPKGRVSEQTCPLEVVAIPTQGGRATTPAVIRIPPGAKRTPCPESHVTAASRSSTHRPT